MKSIIRPAAVILAITLCPGLVTASGPIGVYALVDKVASGYPLDSAGHYL